MLILCIVQNKSKKSNCFSADFCRPKKKRKKKEQKRFLSSFPLIPPIYSLLKEKK